MNNYIELLHFSEKKQARKDVKLRRIFLRRLSPLNPD